MLFGRAPLPRAASDRHEQGLSPSCDSLLSLGACVDSFIRSLHRRSPPTSSIQMLRCSRYSVCVRYVIPSAARRSRVLRCFLANTVFHIVRQSFRALTTYSLAKHVVRIDRPSSLCPTLLGIVTRFVFIADPDSTSLFHF